MKSRSGRSRIGQSVRHCPSNRRGLCALEKLFLGTMALFGSFILVLFSLYFDLPDICKGSMDRSSGITLAAYENARDRAIRAGTPREVMPGTPNGNAAFGIPNGAFDRLGCAFAPAIENERAPLVAAARKKLVARGIKDERLLRMLSKGAFRLRTERIAIEVDILLSRGEYDAAARRLEAALANGDPEDLLNTEALLQRLVFLHLDGKDKRKARLAMHRLERTRRSIADIRSGEQA